MHITLWHNFIFNIFNRNLIFQSLLSTSLTKRHLFVSFNLYMKKRGFKKVDDLYI